MSLASPCLVLLESVLADVAQLLVHLGHLLLVRSLIGSGVRMLRDHVLALGVDQVVAVEDILAGVGVAA